MRLVEDFLGGFCRVLLALGLIVWSGQVQAEEETEIFLWVANQLEIESVPEMPLIHFVDKETLHAIFRESNQTSFAHWADQYGQTQAAQIMDRYLEAMVGLYDSTADAIYVYALLPPCRRRATLVHEFCHFFQFVTDGAISLDQYDSDILHLVREMKAYQIEKKYRAEHCTAEADVVF